ncbi:hypothetical protein [Microbacterium rhizomatis]|uniref:Uncharacterized protein n=1 Tax=Microbacterium rhizomatis TaxID=1631477 RepID=A0A5J5J074_9MICO|nr:hypothetical protein [Microbacterium rhizomatis]KAA9107707.1 hypothetical protein F6B43_09670 [Microbacterium rhizomatis]
MPPAHQGRFTLVERGGDVWEIATERDDLVAVIVRAEDDHVEVSWQPGIPLPHVYTTAEVAMTDLVMWESRSPGGTKPIPIPHAPPMRA